MAKKIKILFILEAYIGGTRKHIRQILFALTSGDFIREVRLFDNHEGKTYTSIACKTSGKEQKDQTSNYKQKVVQELFFAVSPYRFSPGFEEDMEEYKKLGIKVRIIPLKRNPFAFSNFAALSDLISLIKYEKFDIIHTHSSIAGAIGRIAAIVALGRYEALRRVIHTPHLFPFEMGYHSLMNYLLLLAEKFFSKYTSMVIAVCEYEKNIALSRVGISSNKVTLIYNALDTVEYDSLRLGAFPFAEDVKITPALSKNDFIVGFCGRLEPQKDPITFLKALECLFLDTEHSHISNRTRIKGLIVGSGSLSGKVSDYIKKSGLSDKIVRVEQQISVKAYYKIMDLLIVPSRWEAFPYVILEGMACNVPVIASSVGGIPEVVINNETGMLFQPGDYSELTEIIRELIDNESKRKSLSEKAHEYVKNKFIFSENFTKLLSLYIRK